MRKCGATGPIYCMLIRSMLPAAVNGKDKGEAYRRAVRLVACIWNLGMYPFLIHAKSIHQRPSDNGKSHGGTDKEEEQKGEPPFLSHLPG